MALLNEIYDPCQNGPSKNQPPSIELQSQPIEVEIQLKKHVNSILSCLQNDLQQHNMNMVAPDPDTNTITITGYPLVNGFDEFTVLAIVQRRDPQAILRSSRLL